MKKKQGGRRPGAGRKKLGEDRGGLTRLLVQVYADQAERLRSEGGQGETVRQALDEYFQKNQSESSTP